MAPLGPFARDRACAVALSGGADSTALALLAAGWGRPTALIVDHGLRPESGEEAGRAAERVRHLGIPATVLPLDGLPPGPGIARRARAARYDALTAACRRVGIADLLVAHHAGDQAETVLMRAERGSGGDGLAGMAAETVRDGVRLLRPLLRVPPARLRATLRTAGVGWEEDPTNRDAAYARVRARRRLSDGAASGPDPATLLARAALGAATRAEADRLAAGWAARWVVLRPDGTALVCADAVPPRVLAALLRTLAGREHLPGGNQVASLAGSLRPATLAGVRVLLAGRVGPGWLLARERAAVAAPVRARPGARWDGRFVLAAAPPGDAEAWIGALGDDAAGLRRFSSLPAAALQVLPAVRILGRLAAVPHLPWPDAATCAAWDIRFAPKVPVAGAAFVSS